MLRLGGFDGSDGGAGGPNAVVDLDNDGYPASQDCDDGNPDINSGKTEICDDGIDNTCDGDDFV